MTCTTCTQTDFKSIHGRVFCANCGSAAASRLQNFKATSSESGLKDRIGHTSVLDLSKPATPTKGPNQSHPQNGPSLSGISRPQQHTPKPLDPTTYQAPVQSALEKAPEAPPLATPTAPTDTTPAPTTVSSVFDNTAGEQVTFMQPHQTYSIKGESTGVNESYSGMDIDTSELDKNSDRKSPLFGRFFANSFFRTGVIALSMVVLTGYVTYLNYPNMALRVAANRASIEARMPGYLPSGYSFNGPIAHSPGQLVVTFSGNDGGIALSQSETRWDSRSLLENKIRLSASTYDTYRENGLTIYTYEGRHAAWVNSGILYEIESDTELDPDEIIRMASSL